jgi:hypothetical protein
MAIPEFQRLMLPVLRLAGDGQVHTVPETVQHLAREFQLSDADVNEQVPSGQPRINNRLGWATTYLRKAQLLKSAGPGRFHITDRGREILATNPATVDVGFLESRFPEIAEFRRGSNASIDGDDEPAEFLNNKWQLRADVATRVQAKVEKALPDEHVRADALRFLAFAIEKADEERQDAWIVRDTSKGIRLNTGRLFACDFTRSLLRVSVIGPVSEDLRSGLGAEASNDEEFKFIPGAVVLSFPVDRAAVALELLSEGLNMFIDLAMAKVRRSVSLDDHVPEAVEYIASVVGRELPQPRPQPEQDDSQGEEVGDGADEEATVASREPIVRGRAPIFEHGQRSIASLVSDIEREVIALPDLQRPFVWEDVKVRDLLDSLFLGFPVGTLVFWHTANDKDTRALGTERPGLLATALVIDGQQRLTSLFSVMTGADVVGKDGEPRKIAIAFRPRDGRFEVADAAIRKDPEFLPDVTELWSGKRPKPQIRRDLLNALRDKGRVVDERYEDAVERNLDRAYSIAEYRFPTVDIRKTAASSAEDITEEDVADIFVRINNQGTKLGQADFVLTLLSVFHGELRDRFEDRSRSMSDGAVVAIDTQQLLRAACGVAFGRARMAAMYRYLRGIDPNTGDADIKRRETRLTQLDDAANECMEPTPWRDFLLRVRHAGFVNQSLIASKNAIVNAYTFYIRGRRAFVAKSELDSAISRWIFGTLLTARYSGSSETVFEQDLSRVGRLEPADAASFVRVLDDALGETLTGDYWTHTLVAALETQKTRAPAALAFRAAQIILRTRALFSDQLLQNLMETSPEATRAASEAHHLFPEAWLYSRGIRDRRSVNQVANKADTGWHENSIIGARGPADYVPRLRDKLKITDDQWGRLCAEHALPLAWERLDYFEFLTERRRRMAEIIRVAFRQLGGEADAPPITPPWFLPGSEVVWLRIAEAERALRTFVRDLYSARFHTEAAARIEQTLPEREREGLGRSLRSRPAGADALSIVDYLYLGQLVSLLFSPATQQEARTRLGGGGDVKQRLTDAVAKIAPVRNEIAHVREVAPERLMRASVACADVLEILRNADSRSVG